MENLTANELRGGQLALAGMILVANARTIKEGRTELRLFLLSLDPADRLLYEQHVTEALSLKYAANCTGLDDYNAMLQRVGQIIAFSEAHLVRGTE